MPKAKNVVVLCAALVFMVGIFSTGYAGDALKVDINKASKEELMQLEGVGDAYAQKIVEYRKANGPFKQPGDIMKVKGIGPATYEKNKDRITVALDAPVLKQVKIE